MTETENQTRLRRARESLNSCRLAEDAAREAHGLAVLATKTAREKYYDLFLEEEKQEAARRKANS